MIIIGVTGNFGSGKSTVAAMFTRCAKRARRGAAVVDADEVVRELLVHDEVCRCAIRGAFGDRVMTKGEIDRAKLSAAAFADKKLLLKLESIIHPLVKTRVEREIRKFRGKMFVVDAALLIEAGWQGMLDVLIVVRSTVKEEISRLRRRSGHSRADVLRRLKYQLPFRQKREHADFIVDNRGRLDDTHKQVKEIFDTLLKQKHQQGASV
jgi:dephospho-CoA kinase